MRPRHLLFAVLVCAVLYAAKLATQRITPAFPGLAANIEGAFPLDGQYAGEPLAHAHGVRVWGSWAGNDASTGALALGPFPAPALLRFAVGGYPMHAGNQLYVELAGTKARRPVKFDFDVGERWRVVDFYPPADWIGKPIAIVARDEAKTIGGWIAVSEPLRGGLGSGHAEFFETLAAWSISGLLLGLLWFAALRHVTARAWVAPHWAPLVAAAVVAACGYAAFWAYFAHAMPGRIFSVALLMLGVAGALRRGKSDGRPGAEAMAAPKLLCAIGLFYIALLHFFPSSLDFYTLAANRFRDGLPGDNTLPRNVAYSLFNGDPLRVPGVDWLSSDRPPLQSGWMLLTWPVTAALHFDERTASGAAAIWLQSLWVFGVYGLLRSLGLARARASAWLAVMALAGFFAQNTVFTWPKLSAAAFACGAFGLWMFPQDPGRRRTEVLIGAAFAGLAWLSHGGVAFSFLVLVPWVAWRTVAALYERRHQSVGGHRPPLQEWRTWALVAVVFALFAAPWLAYQKFYDPPGNRLLKWHLAGVIPKDARGTWLTIRESYGALSWRDIAANKTANLKRQFEGDWRRWWRDFSAAGAPQRRVEEFFFTARALTWWLLGLAALPVALARGRLRTVWRAHAALAAWTLAALVAWCLLMFAGGQAVIHQGSYAVMLGLFVLLSAWLEFAGAWTLAIMAGLQAVSFATTWAVPNATVHGPLNWIAFTLALAAATAVVVLVVREHRGADRP